MPPKKEFICPFHDDFEKRVEKLGDTAEKEDDGIWDRLDEHDKRLKSLENGYVIITQQNQNIIDKQDFFNKLLSGVLIAFIIYIILWLSKTFIMGI